MIFSFDLLVLQTMLFLYVYVCVCVCMYPCACVRVHVCMRVKTGFQGLWTIEVGDRTVVKGATRESS